MMKQVTVVERPLAKQNLTQLRAKSAGHLEFRWLLREIALLMGQEAAHSFETVPVEVQIHRDNCGKGFVDKSEGEVKNLSVTIPKRLKSWREEDRKARQ
jgi:uracil phosphoribosyltransferase